MTKDQMIVNLAFRSKVLLWSCIALGSLSIGVLGYAVVRYNSFSIVEPYALDMFFSYKCPILLPTLDISLKTKCFILVYLHSN